MQPPKFKKESRSRGCKAQAFSGSGVKFLTAIREVCCGVNSLRFLREILPKARPWAKQWLLAIFWSKCNFLSDKALPWAVRMGEVHRCIQVVCYGFMVRKFERSFVKDLSSSLKTFINFATVLQNDRGAGPLLCFLRVKGNFFQKVPLWFHGLRKVPKHR